MFLHCCATQAAPPTTEKEEHKTTGAFDDDIIKTLEALVQADIDAWGPEATEMVAEISHENWSEILRLRSRAKAVENFRMWRRGSKERWRREVLFKDPISRKAVVIQKDLMTGPRVANFYLSIVELKIIGSLTTEEWKAVVELEHRWHDWMELPTEDYGRSN